VIKRIPVDLLNEEEKKEVYLESKILESLDHPNIIKFKEVFLTKPPNSYLHLVMDYADGGDLKSRLTQTKTYFGENQILDWFTQTCLAIKHMHDRKILHRDIKSQNIFLTKSNIIKLGDFGIAKCLSYTLEKVQTVTGTPYYLSPEIASNKPYSFKSDVWSLGVLLYEMCSLKMPFNAQSLDLLLSSIKKGIFKQIPKHYSKDLKALVEYVLQINPDNRPSIKEILSINSLFTIECDLIKTRIKSFLNELEYNKEFSHTILHKYHILNTNGSNSQVNTSKTSSNSVDHAKIKNNKKNTLNTSDDPINSKDVQRFHSQANVSSGLESLSLKDKPQSLDNKENKQDHLTEIQNVLAEHKYI
jgi:NIMA (never in mitosis gene a)-related kinase